MCCPCAARSCSLLLILFVFICAMAGDALHGTSAPSCSLALSPPTHSYYAQSAMPHDWPRIWPPYCSLMQVAWPCPACTLTKAPPSQSCPVVSLARGIVIRVPSKSFSAVRKNRSLPRVSRPGLLPPASRRSTFSSPPSPCACLSAMHEHDRPVGYGGRKRHSSPPRVRCPLLVKRRTSPPQRSPKVPDQQAVDLLCTLYLQRRPVLPSVRRRNLSHPLARDEDAVGNDGHGNRTKLALFPGLKGCLLQT